MASLGVLALQAFLLGFGVCISRGKPATISPSALACHPQFPQVTVQQATKARALLADRPQHLLDSNKYWFGQVSPGDRASVSELYTFGLLTGFAHSWVVRPRHAGQSV